MNKAPKSNLPKASKKEGKDLTPILSYFGILFLIPLLICKDSRFAQFHAKQGLVLFIAEAIVFMISLIPFIGWLIGFVCWIACLVLSVMGIINVVNGRQILLPIIGKFAKNFEF